jgi:hypothetical protein
MSEFDNGDVSEAVDVAPSRFMSPVEVLVGSWDVMSGVGLFDVARVGALVGRLERVLGAMTAGLGQAS